MIVLENVTKYYGWGRDTKLVLSNLNASFDTSKSIGVLGMNGSGKSTLLSIIAGAMSPTSGRVLRGARVSWPLGLRGSAGNLSGEENIRFICRIYGADRKSVTRFVQDFSELGDDLFRPISTYSSGMRSRLSVAVSLAIDFDVYLMDEGLSVADKRFSQRFSQAMSERLNRSTLIIVSHNMGTISRYCKHGAVLHNRSLTDVMALPEAVKAYNKFTSQQAQPNP